MHIVNLEELISGIEKRIDVILSNIQERSYSFWLQCRGMKKESHGSCLFIAEKIKGEVRKVSRYGTNFQPPNILHHGQGCRPEITKRAGRKKNTIKRCKGNPHIKSAVCEAAVGVSRSRNQRVGIKYWSLAARRGRERKKHSLPSDIEC